MTLVLFPIMEMVGAVALLLRMGEARLCAADRPSRWAPRRRWAVGAEETMGTGATRH